MKSKAAPNRIKRVPNRQVQQFAPRGKITTIKQPARQVKLSFVSESPPIDASVKYKEFFTEHMLAHSDP